MAVEFMDVAVEEGTERVRRDDTATHGTVSEEEMKEESRLYGSHIKIMYEAGKAWIAGHPDAVIERGSVDEKEMARFIEDAIFMSPSGSMTHTAVVNLRNYYAKGKSNGR